MDHWRYLDFDIKITRVGDHYLAHVYNAPAGQANVEFSLPFSPLEIENLILKMTRLRTSSRAIDSPEVEAARTLGGKLFEAVFQGLVRDCFRDSLGRAQEQENTGLRIKLRLQDTPELAELPWEFLYDARQRSFLAHLTETPLVRFVETPQPVRPLQVTPPLRILAMISNPSGVQELNSQREKDLLQRALAPF